MLRKSLVELCGRLVALFHAAEKKGHLLLHHGNELLPDELLNLLLDGARMNGAAQNDEVIVLDGHLHRIREIMQDRRIAEGNMNPFGAAFRCAVAAGVDNERFGGSIRHVFFNPLFLIQYKFTRFREERLFDGAINLYFH